MKTETWTRATGASRGVRAFVWTHRPFHSKLTDRAKPYPAARCGARRPDGDERLLPGAPARSAWGSTTA